MIVSINKVAKRYSGVWVLKEVSGEFSSPNVVAIIGRNGEGKSTLVKIVSGVVKADGGGVLVDGEQPCDPRAKKRMGVSFQSPSFFPGLSLKDNLVYHVRFFGLKPSASEINEALGDVGLLGFSDKKFESLSEGTKKKAEIAKVLLTKEVCDLFLLDEPFSGVDPAGRDTIMRSLKAVSKESGKLIVYVSHTLAEIEELATRVCLLADGRFAREWSGQEFSQVLRKTSSGVLIRVPHTYEIDDKRVRALNGVLGIHTENESTIIRLESQRSLPEVLEALKGSSVDLEAVEIERAGLEEALVSIYREAVGNEHT